MRTHPFSTIVCALSAMLIVTAACSDSSSHPVQAAKKQPPAATPPPPALPKHQPDIETKPKPEPQKSSEVPTKPATKPIEPLPTDPATNPVQSDADVKLAAKVRTAIMNDTELASIASSVTVVVRGGTVTLQGRVKDQEQKDATEAVAKSVTGVDKVENQLVTES